MIGKIIYKIMSVIIGFNLKVVLFCIEKLKSFKEIIAYIKSERKINRINRWDSEKW